MFIRSLLQKLRGTEVDTTDGASEPTLELNTLYKKEYFADKFDEVQNAISRITNIKVNEIERVDGSHIIVKFSREGKLYKASFFVEREKNATTYSLKVDIPNVPKQGKNYYKKSGGRSPEAVVHAIIYSFHEAFVSE